MAERIPQSVTKRVSFEAYLTSDHVSPATGKTIAITISKNGAAFGNPSGGATNAVEIASGSYYVDLTTTDTGTLGPLIILGSVALVDAVKVHFSVENAHNAGFDGVPSAVAGAAGGLPTGDASGRVDVGKTLGNAVTLDANNVLNVSAKYVGGTLQTARDLGASVLLSAGTGTGQLDFTSGVVKANLVQILATALTETAGLLAGGFKKFFNVVAPTLTCLGVDQTGDSYARLGAPAGASHAADVAAVKSDTAAVKVQTDKLAFTVANQVDSNVLDWKSSAAPAMTGDAFARLGAPAGASVSADVAAVKVDTAAVKAKTDNLPASPAATGAQMDLVAAPNATALNAIADSLLKRDWSSVAGEAAHSVLNALRFLRNKWSVSAGTLTVTKEDGATAAWTGTVATDAAAVPVVGNTPS